MGGSSALSVSPGEASAKSLSTMPCPTLLSPDAGGATSPPRAAEGPSARSSRGGASYQDQSSVCAALPATWRLAHGALGDAVRSVSPSGSPDPGWECQGGPRVGRRPWAARPPTGERTVTSLPLPGSFPSRSWSRCPFYGGAQAPRTLPTDSSASDSMGHRPLGGKAWPSCRSGDPYAWTALAPGQGS